MTNELTILKGLLKTDYIAEHSLDDTYLNLYLSLASNSITKWKGSAVYDKDLYVYERAKIAYLNLIKVGAEGQASHEENGIKRVYTYPDIEMEVLTTIPTILK